MYAYYTTDSGSCVIAGTGVGDLAEVAGNYLLSRFGHASINTAAQITADATAYIQVRANAENLLQCCMVASVSPFWFEWTCRDHASWHRGDMSTNSLKQVTISYSENGRKLTVINSS